VGIAELSSATYTAVMFMVSSRRVVLRVSICSLNTSSQVLCPELPMCQKAWQGRRVSRPLNAARKLLMALGPMTRAALGDLRRRASQHSRHSTRTWLMTLST
jgi:hypothetical protein